MDTKSTVKNIGLKQSFVKNEKVFLIDQLEPYISDYVYVLEFTLKGYSTEFITKCVEQLKIKWTFDPTFTQARKIIFQLLDDSLN